MDVGLSNETFPDLDQLGICQMSIRQIDHTLVQFNDRTVFRCAYPFNVRSRWMFYHLWPTEQKQHLSPWSQRDLEK